MIPWLALLKKTDWSLIVPMPSEGVKGEKEKGNEEKKILRG